VDTLSLYQQLLLLLLLGQSSFTLSAATLLLEGLLRAHCHCQPSLISCRLDACKQLRLQTATYRIRAGQMQAGTAAIGVMAQPPHLSLASLLQRLCDHLDGRPAALHTMQ
jgi:hypothetical protein